ncbi:MAG: hypothetical protein V4638_11260 [Bacteroidota bacterium]
MLEREFDYYLSHQKELITKYLNKYLVIKDEQVANSFDTKEEAYDFATSNYELGTFLIQQCLPGDLGHSQIFHSQVIFATI